MYTIPLNQALLIAELRRGERLVSIQSDLNDLRMAGCEVNITAAQLLMLEENNLLYNFETELCEDFTLSAKEDRAHCWHHYTCDACGKPFTAAEWDARETPHEPYCPNAEGEDDDVFVECVCDRNYHAACFTR